MSTSDLDAIDFFHSTSLYQDPYPYYDALRRHGPAWREPHQGVVMVTGYQEAMAVYNDPATFSSCNAVVGPFAEFPVPLEGDDISAIIEEHRDGLPFEAAQADAHRDHADGQPEPEVDVAAPEAPARGEPHDRQVSQDEHAYRGPTLAGSGPPTGPVREATSDA